MFAASSDQKTRRRSKGDCCGHGWTLKLNLLITSRQTPCLPPQQQLSRCRHLFLTGNITVYSLLTGNSLCCSCVFPGCGLSGCGVSACLQRMMCESETGSLRARWLHLFNWPTKSQFLAHVSPQCIFLSCMKIEKVCHSNTKNIVK